MEKLKKPLCAVFLIYTVCYLFRFIEYFWIQTDRTFWGEAFLHKLTGIVVLCIAVKVFAFRFPQIGFAGQGIFKYILYGLAFGGALFVIAYGIEIWISVLSGSFKALKLYVSSYSVDGNEGNRTGFIFFVICIIGNIINVIMEEGIFRGLFQKLLEEKYRFITSATLASMLFGVWHIIAPIREFYEGGSMGGMIANILILLITTSLIGFKFAMLTKITGSLYMAMGDHFVNNTIVNILHVATTNGTDELMFIRISIAQTLSFIIVLTVYLKKYHKKHPVIQS